MQNGKTIIKEEISGFKYTDIIKWDFLEKGTYGQVYKIYLKSDQEAKYALKKMDLNEGEKYYKMKEDEILKEIDILKIISLHIKKLKSIPRYYGYFIISDPQISQISYCLIFELKDGSLKGLIENRSQDIKVIRKFAIDEIYATLQVLLNIMTYLQLNSITHRDLKPGNILFTNLLDNKTIQYKSLTLIDFGGSKCLLPYNSVNIDNTIIMTKRYCSPELMFFSAIEKKDKADFNPFKSDVFSMGLIILEMGTFKLPFCDKEGLKSHQYFSDLDKENKILIEKMRKDYFEINKKNPEEIKKLNEIIQILTRCLMYKYEKRPDFLELFCEFYKIDNQYIGNKEYILQKILEHDRRLCNGSEINGNLEQSSI